MNNNIIRRESLLGQEPLVERSSGILVDAYSMIGGGLCFGTNELEHYFIVAGRKHSMNPVEAVIKIIDILHTQSMDEFLDAASMIRVRLCAFEAVYGLGTPNQMNYLQDWNRLRRQQNLNTIFLRPPRFTEEMGAKTEIRFYVEIIRDALTRGLLVNYSPLEGELLATSKRTVDQKQLTQAPAMAALGFVTDALMYSMAAQRPIVRPAYVPPKHNLRRY